MFSVFFLLSLRWGSLGANFDPGKDEPNQSTVMTVFYLSGDVWGVPEIHLPQHFCREFPTMTNVFWHDLHLLNCRLLGVRPLLSGSRSSLIGHQHLDPSLQFWQA